MDAPKPTSNNIGGNQANQINAQPTTPLKPTTPPAGNNNGVDSINPPPSDNGSFGSSIIGGLHYSVTNLSDWAKYLGQTAVTKLFSSAPVINKDKFIALISTDQKTPKEKMAALNGIISLGADNPELQQDVVFLLRKFNEINPAVGTEFCNCIKHVSGKADEVNVDTIVTSITADAPAAFTLMKTAMIRYYSAPFLDNPKFKLEIKQLLITKLYLLDCLFKTPELKETLTVLDKQPIAKEVVQAILTVSLPHLVGLGAFMIQADQSLPENGRFGLFAIAEANKTETPEAVLRRWVTGDSFNLKTFKKYVRECYFKEMPQYLCITPTSSCLFNLTLFLDQVPSNKMVDIVGVFTKDNTNDLIFGDIVQAMIQADDPAKPILPADVRTKDQMKGWLIKEEKFKTEIKDGNKVKVDEYAPKVVLLRKAIDRVRIAAETQEKTIALNKKVDAFIANVGTLAASVICKELLEVSNNALVINEQLIKMLAAVGDKQLKVFSAIAKSVIKGQVNSATNDFAQKAKQLKQSVTNNEYSAERQAEKIKNEEFRAVTMLFGDPLIRLQRSGLDKEMDEGARNDEFKKYINSAGFDKAFVTSGLSIYQASLSN